MEEEKNYVPIDLDKNKRYASFKEHGEATQTPEEAAARQQRNARMAFAYALTGMRLKAGISQVVMAGAMHCQQPHISRIERSPNDKISMATILKYVEVTGQPFKASLEDGKVVIVQSPRKGRKMGPSPIAAA